MKLIIFLTTLLAASSSAKARNIYLNGIDISSARHEQLESVTIKIDGQGNIYISAPHYQVNEENTYIPLSRWDKKLSGPKHTPPKGLNNSELKPADTQSAEKETAEKNATDQPKD
tara:strand:+ start:1382 stop:1726 length:345 start_codon:yes stop_codon:yes gene_type:complete